LPEVVTADDRRLRQVLLNLLGNAIKFTDQGMVALRVSCTPTGPAELLLRLDVEDTGIGMRPDDLHRIFEPFEQVGDEQRRSGGTGLGLAITRELVEMMGGTIAVQSRLGEGSSFRVELPLARVADAETGEADPSDAADAEPAHAPTVRVLAAEDNEVNQLVLKTLLEQIGLAAVVVSNGEEAVEAWTDGAWDIILMDIQMPQMDGLMAAQAIRAKEAAEGRARTPIVAVTANVMSHQVAQYLQAGMDAVVAKPLQLQTLLETMEAALAGQSEAEDQTPAAAASASGPSFATT
jgi:CheY-like chemotaxis protein